MSLVVNGIPVASMRWLAAWSGVWVAELDVAGDLLPVGKVAIASTEGILLTGTVDTLRSGEFGERRHARVLGGGGGWAKPVRAKHYNSPVGVPLASVASTTAAEAGEVVVILTPKIVGLDFVRRNGPASQIFDDADVDWWVGTDGTTRVGIRPPLPPPASLHVIDWDAVAATVSFTADALVEPGTVIVDARFGKRVVTKVEALVSGGAVTGTLWVAESAPPRGTVSELAGALAALARKATGAEFARLYEYRVYAMAGDRVELQAVRKSDGVPDILPASIWAGASGYRAVLRPGSRVLVGFIAGEASKPYVAAYEPPEADGWRPLKVELDAISSVEIGAQAIGVLLGSPLGAQPVARSTGVLTALAAISVYAEAVALVSPSTAPAAQVLVAALAPLAALIPSGKVLAS